MVGKLLRGRMSRAVVATALVATVFAVASGTPTSAAPQSKGLTGSCAGADDASKGLLAAFGGALTVPFTVTSDVPATLPPNAPDQPISFTWGVTLAASVTSQVAGIDPTLTIKDTTLDIEVKGPTSTTEVQGRPATKDLAVSAGVPATLTQGPFAGTLKDIGKGGIIKYSPKKIGFTISLDISGKATDVKVACTAPGTVATTSIKIPGSPDIVQPIVVTGTPNQAVTVDVLGSYVSAGTDEKGVKRAPLPETLKVLEGPGTVSNGKVLVSAAGPGSTSSVTFEVCSGTLPGTNEVQTLVLDPSSDALKKGVGFTLKFGDAETVPIWMVSPAWRLAFPGNFNKPTNWVEQANSYIFTPYELPSPTEIQLALERLPAIGAGGVKVTGGGGRYNMEFIGKNAEKDVDSVGIGSYYSVFPQEVLASIITAAKDLLGGGSGPTTTPTTFPGNLTLDEYVKKLEGDLYLAQLANDLPKSLQILGELIPLKLKQGLANINVNEAISFLTGLFSTPPGLTTATAGDTPIGICSQGVIDVNVAVVSGASTATVAGATATQGAPLAFTG
jgi:hypothetical protein